ncbi:hypothetical protein EW026_g3191 [Hermanssonia centrifuga]|uniref:Uncharacterized protein n=1 Tax=Hermanssonia centrifuga TaxID=98765 RepID=A0A4S4KLI4_9APHY|nr:hypothetical protein EW026_g3191 [Hermanssonia centrifuga]
MKALEARHMIVCLHQSGYIEVYSTQDGTCLAAANVEDGHFSPPPGTKANSKLPVIWKWKSLHVASIAEQGFLLLACASPKATTSTLQTLESNEADREEETRIVAFQVQVSREGGPDGIMLKKMGDWSLDGYAESVELIAENDARPASHKLVSALHQAET